MFQKIGRTSGSAASTLAAIHNWLKKSHSMAGRIIACQYVFADARSGEFMPTLQLRRA
jgi:hypothetical protein